MDMPSSPITAREGISRIFILAILLTGLYTPGHAQQGPSTADCTALYDHIIKISQADKELSFAIRPGTENPEAEKQAVQHCISTMSKAEVQCKLNAKTIQGLHNCPSNSKDSPKKDLTTEQKLLIENQRVEKLKETEKRKELEKQKEKFDEKKNEKKNLTENNTENSEVLTTEETTPEGCKKTYDHMLVLFATSPDLKTEQGKKLLANWNASLARNSFINRCTAVFQPSDLKCILSTKDSDVIQGCLLAVPEE